MNRFAEWIADFRWAMNVKRARAWRRQLSFSAREHFDHAIRPRIKGEPGKVIAYPDAIYHITIDDLTRAMVHSSIWERDPSRPSVTRGMSENGIG